MGMDIEKVVQYECKVCGRKIDVTRTGDVYEEPVFCCGVEAAEAGAAGGMGMEEMLPLTMPKPKKKPAKKAKKKAAKKAKKKAAKKKVAKKKAKKKVAKKAKKKAAKKKAKKASKKRRK
jgi:hypothetical protein